MIRELTIKNYALIDELDMVPSNRLSIVTGETGAGKSIILGAIGLLLGNRSDSKALLKQDKKCVVEARFDIGPYNLKGLFEEEEVDYDSECIIRREINTSGKSRAFVNDTPVRLPFLKELGSRLIDVHSQHESLQLNKKVYQLSVLDAFAANEHLKVNYHAKFLAFVQVQEKLAELNSMANESSEDADYKQYLLKELDEANLAGFDQADAEKELEVLENSEEILQKLAQANQLMDDPEISISQLLSELRSCLHAISRYSDDLDALAQRAESLYLEFQDMAGEVGQSSERIEYDPERIQFLKSTLDTLYRLQTKHKVNTVEELLDLQRELSDQLSLTSNLDDQIKKVEKELEEAYESMMSEAEILTESRKLASLDLSAEIEKVIRKIGIENGQVDITIDRTEPGANGMDEVNILFSANKGIAPEDISKVASGGEFSRLIFAIKYLTASRKAMPTVIFDEIDTGVSGEVALKMTGMMKEMSKKHQVLAISHLPQFAAGGDEHFFVYKDHSADRSISKIKRLDEEDRITEIAKMIGGNTPTESAFSSARELLGIG